MYVSMCARVCYVLSFPLPPPLSLSLSLSLLYIPTSGLSAGVYATNGPDACHYVLEHSKSNIVVVENQKQLDKILQVRKIPLQKYIINTPNKNAGARSPSSLEGYCSVQGKAESGLREWI